MARTDYLEHAGPLAMAHRGFSREGLENSMSAFVAAVDLGFRYVETDVHATSDGVLLAVHDDTLDRVTDGHGRIEELRYAEVRQARIGGREHVPTLDEVLHAWPRLRVNVDIKSPGAVLPLVEVIERHAAHQRVCVTSFSDRRRLRALRRLSRPVATSAGQRRTTAFFVGVRSGSSMAVRQALSGVDCLQVPVSHSGLVLVSERTVAAAHRAGVQMHVWTVNEPAEMERLLDLGVDGVITDRADLLREVLQRRGQWPG